MNKELYFEIKDGFKQARTGRLFTSHGSIETPAFVPVGTQATVKATRPKELVDIGVQIVMCNTYHLYLRPGPDVINELGGLHQFMGWNGPIMTDSGGFQVLSLGAGIEHGVGKQVDLFADDSKIVAVAGIKETSDQLVPREKFCFVTDDKIIFKSHLDGTFHEWTPEKSVEVQNNLGADIVFALDECTSPLHDREYTEISMKRSHAWEERSLAAHQKSGMILQGVSFKDRPSKNQAMYGIIQGGPYEDLRRKSAKFVDGKDFFGVGIGGAMVNKSKMNEILGWVVSELTGDKPVHLLGIGSIDDIFAGVDRGVDTFDCADPTRIARRGDVLLSPEDGGSLNNRWRMNIAAAKFRRDPGLLGKHCGCPACQERFSRGYINHLMWAKELTGYTLTTLHNLWVMNKLMDEIREGIAGKQLGKVKERWMG